MKLESIVFFALIVFCSAIPVFEEEVKPVKTESIKTKEKLRQDEEDGVGEIEQVGEQVSQIINGVLTGNFGQIFGGSTGFITETDTQAGVDNILVGVATPLNTILAQAVKQGQQYYNITTAPPPTLFPPTPQPVLVVVNHVTQPEQQNGLPLNPVVIQPQQHQLPSAAQVKAQPAIAGPAALVAAPVQQTPSRIATGPHEPEAPEVVTASHGEDEDEDSESEAKLRKQ